jgi:trehalose 6-phosphate synthase
MTEALLVNPYDPDDIADAMHLAFTMDWQERFARHSALRQKVFTTTAAAYTERFLKALEGDTRAPSGGVAAALRRFVEAEWPVEGDDEAA